MKLHRKFWPAALGAVLLLLAIANVSGLLMTDVHRELAYSELVKAVEQGDVRDVAITGDELVGHFADGREFQSVLPAQQQSFIDVMVRQGVGIRVDPAGPNALANAIIYWLPSIVFIGVLIYYLRGIRQALRASADKLDALPSRIAQLTQGERRP